MTLIHTKKFLESAVYSSLTEKDPFFLEMMRLNQNPTTGNILKEVFPDLFKRYYDYNLVKELNILLDAGISKEDIRDIFRDAKQITQYVEVHPQAIEFNTFKDFKVSSKYLKKYYKNSKHIGQLAYRGIKNIWGTLPLEKIKQLIDQNIAKNKSFSIYIGQSKQFAKENGYIIVTRITKENLLMDLTAFYNEGEVLLNLQPGRYQLYKASDL